MTDYEGHRATRRPILRSGLAARAPIRKPKPSPTKQCATCRHTRKEHRWGTKGCTHVDVALFAYGAVPIDRCTCDVFTEVA